MNSQDNKILETLKKQAKKDKNIIAVLLFGSFLNSKFYRDIDIAIILKNRPTNLEMSKKKLSYQKISSKLDIQIFQQLPLYIRSEILKKNKPLIIKNYGKTFDICVDTIKEFDFFEKYYNDYLEHIKDGSKEKATV